MLRSLFSGISGMKNHQIRLDVIGNNIANVNTMGYKANRVVFKDVFSQTLRSGNTGQNPLQVGLGVALGSIDTLHTTGNLQSTGVATDLALEGNGFFMVMDDEGTISFTRAGNFGFDHEGYLVSMTNGNKVLGMSDFAVSSFFIADYSSVGANESIRLQVGEEAITINFPAVIGGPDDVIDAIEASSPYLTAVIDNSTDQLLIRSIQGRKLTILDATALAGVSGERHYQFFAAASNSFDPTAIAVAVDGQIEVKLGENNPIVVPVYAGQTVDEVVKAINEKLEGRVKAWVEDDPLIAGNEILKLKSLEAGTPIMITSDTSGLLSGIGMIDAAYRFVNIIESDPQFVPIRINPDKMTSIKTISITSDGALTFDATEDIRFYDTNGNEILDYMNVAAFIAPNPSGLDKIGENQYKATIAGVGNQSLNGISKMRVLRNYSLLRDYAAGKTLDEFASKTGVGVPGTGGAGLVRSGFLEMSNVDLAEEFTNMIVTQRGFQANSRVITTSDEILQELVNLKR